MLPLREKTERGRPKGAPEGRGWNPPADLFRSNSRFPRNYGFVSSPGHRHSGHSWRPINSGSHGPVPFFRLSAFQIHLVRHRGHLTNRHPKTNEERMIATPIRSFARDISPPDLIEMVSEMLNHPPKNTPAIEAKSFQPCLLAVIIVSLRMLVSSRETRIDIEAVTFRAVHRRTPDLPLPKKENRLRYRWVPPIKTLTKFSIPCRPRTPSRIRSRISVLGPGRSPGRGLRTLMRSRFAVHRPGSCSPSPAFGSAQAHSRSARFPQGASGSDLGEHPP